MVFIRKAYQHEYAKRLLRLHLGVIIAGIIIGLIVVALTSSHLLAVMTLLTVVTIIAAAAVAIFFAGGKQTQGCAAVFAGIVIWIMVCYAGFSRPLDNSRYSKDFSEEVAKIIPQSGNLVAYKHISSRFVHYFGRVVPEIQDKSTLYEHYQRGNWVVATSAYLKGLAADSQFRRVYYRKESRGQKKEDGNGALFHKSAPILKSG